VFLLSFGRLTAYDAAQGAELWSVGDLPLQTVATPVLGDGRLYLCGTGPFGESENAVEMPPFREVAAKADEDGDGLINIGDVPKELLLVDRRMSRGAGNSTVHDFIGFSDADKDQRISEAEWNQFAQAAKQFLAEGKQGVYAVSLDDEHAEPTRIAWTDGKNVPEIPSPLFLDGRLYTVQNGGIVVTRDARTGKMISRIRLNAPGGYFASPVYGDGKIYTASDRGAVSVIDVRGEPKLLATNNLSEPILATPAIVDNNIYIRTERHLYAFGVGRGQK
jgi:outer membrane protein assembly factor BamB